MSNRPKRVARPGYLRSVRTRQGGIDMSWRRPCWGWFGTYLFMFLVGAGALVAAMPQSPAWLNLQLWWAQALGAAGMLVGVWGMAGSLFNRHRVIVNRHQLIRVTRPIRLFDRHVSFDMAQVSRFYLDSRPGTLFGDYRVLVLMNSQRAEELFVTEDHTIAWCLQQSLVGAMRQVGGHNDRMRDLFRRRENAPPSAGGKTLV